MPDRQMGDSMADTDDILERIRRRAHELWESEGRPHGRDSDHWTQAEAEIRGAGALEPTEKAAGSRKKPPISKATSKAAGKSTRAAAESLSEVAGTPAESVKSEPAKPTKAKQASANAKAEDAPKAAGGKTAAKATPAKTPRGPKKDGSKSASAG
jgi:hypothetical protein